MSNDTKNAMDLFEIDLSNAQELDPIDSNGVFIITGGFLVYSKD